MRARIDLNCLFAQKINAAAAAAVAINPACCLPSARQHTISVEA
jgi:hypothetical protein